MRKTKIICTLGPATDSDKILESLIQKGMDVARLNFSHGTHEQQKERMAKVRLFRERYGRPVALLLDTKGPEIRTKNFDTDSVMLQAGNSFTLTGREVTGNSSIVSITYPQLAEDIMPGQHILIDDGLVELQVDSIEDLDIHCHVLNSGPIADHKGINVPDSHINLPYLSETDKQDLLLGIAEDVDYVAASFVRSAEDVNKIRHFLNENNGEDIRIVAKIENREGVEKIDEIIDASDAIMIARGDMGVEIPPEEVPVIQKLIIRKVYEAGKQVITATQMLESMIHQPRPTRAEATDVANAIYDGTSAIMLSGETAAGQYPVEALEMMIRIANRTEHDINYRRRFFQRERDADPDVTDAICHATCTTAHDLNARAIITVTKSGRSARMISKYRPDCDIIGCTITDKVYRQLNLSWGVIPILLQEKKDVFELFEHGICVSHRMQLVDINDTVVLTSGVPIGQSGTTNMIKVQTVTL